MALHTVAGAMSGGVAGAASAATVAGSANQLGELQSHIQAALTNAGASESVANITSQIISQAAAAGLGGAVGTAAGGATGNAGTGAIAGTATGLNVDANNRQLTHPERIEIAKLSQGDPEKTKRYAAAACAMTRCYAEYPENSEQYQHLKALADWGSSRELKAERKTLYEHPTLFNYTRHGLFSEKNIDALKQTNNTYQITNRGLGAIQGILGTAAVAYVGSLCTNPLTCGLGTVSLATNLDYANAGFIQMLNGKPQFTLGEQALQNMGVSKEAAALIYMGIGLVPAFTASTAAEYVANLVKHADSALVPMIGKMTVPPINVGANSVDVSEIVAVARIRQSTMLQDNVGFNISPIAWDAYPTIGRNGTFVSDRQGIMNYFGNLGGKTEITISPVLAAQIEKNMGLISGTLQDGFKVRQVTGVQGMQPLSPLEGNQYFQGAGNHLPGGAPEMVINSIPTVDNSIVNTILKVKVRK